MVDSQIDPEVEELAKVFPVRERRRRKRVLTLHNAKWFALALIIIFILISIASELRYRNSPGEYGRLYSRRTSASDVAPREPYTVVRETNVSEQGGADPMLLDAARRAQYLGVTDEDLAKMRPQPPATDTGPLTIIPRGEPLLGTTTQTSGEKSRFEITGGPEGVQVRTETSAVSDPPR